jgi:NitT/TauT family transport system ATP-binding protein
VHALRGLEFTVPTGQFLSIVGPSGCGKSTLLALIAGLDKPTAGEVKVDGGPLRGPYTEAGVVFQKDLLLDWRTAVQNVLLQFEMRGIRVTDEHRATAVRLLESVGIASFAESYPHQLSGGMRQRVAICRALVHDPELLLLDEPMGALDTITREQLNHDLAMVTAEANKTAILVTHSIEEAVFLGDRVMVMSSAPGRIVADIAIDVARPRRVWPTSGSEFDAYIAEVREALNRGGAYRRVEH